MSTSGVKKFSSSPSSAKENQHRCVCVVGASLSHGQTLQGVDRAPATLRENGLCHLIEKQGWRVSDIGDIQFHQKRASPEELTNVEYSVRDQPIQRPVAGNEFEEHEVPNCVILGESCEKIANAVAGAAKREEFVLTIGGDHSIAAGTIAGKQHPYNTGSTPAGIVI